MFVLHKAVVRGDVRWVRIVAGVGSVGNFYIYLSFGFIQFMNYISRQITKAILLIHAPYRHTFLGLEVTSHWSDGQVFQCECADADSAVSEYVLRLACSSEPLRNRREVPQHQWHHSGLREGDMRVDF